MENFIVKRNVLFYSFGQIMLIYTIIGGISLILDIISYIFLWIPLLIATLVLDIALIICHILLLINNKRLKDVEASQDFQAYAVVLIFYFIVNVISVGLYWFWLFFIWNPSLILIIQIINFVLMIISET